MKTIEQDITTIEEGAIFHQVNCMGTWGAGLARQLRDKFPGAHKDYCEFLREKKHPVLALGSILSYGIGTDLWIISVFGQYDYGFAPTKKHTEYGSLIAAFETFKFVSSINNGRPLYFPAGFGCGLGGGDWTIVSKIIEHYFPDAIICKQKKQH